MAKMFNHQLAVVSLLWSEMSYKLLYHNSYTVVLMC